MSRSIARTGAVAGILTLIGIFLYHGSLVAVAGTRVSGTTDRALIDAYYANDFIATIQPLQFYLVVGLIVFTVAIALAVATTEGARALAVIGLVAVAAEAVAIVAVGALQAALVATVSAGGDPVGLFRLWDALYNSGVYALEATVLVAFGLAMRDAPAFPRWMPRFSLVLGALMVVNSLAIWVGIPDMATLPANILFGGWFIGAIMGLNRIASAPDLVASPQAA